MDTFGTYLSSGAPIVPGISVKPVLMGYSVNPTEQSEIFEIAPGNRAAQLYVYKGGSSSGGG